MSLNEINEAELMVLSDESLIIGYQEFDAVIQAGIDLVNGDAVTYILYGQELKRRGIRV